MSESVWASVRSSELWSLVSVVFGTLILSVILACEPNPSIRVTSPAEGAFVVGDTVTVEGTAVDVSDSTPILVNGIVASRPTANTWSATVPLDQTAVHNRILVDLVMPGHERTILRHVVAVDGVTTAGVADGDLSPNSVALRIENTGFDQIAPVISESVEQALDISELVVAQNPLLDDECVLYNAGNCTHRATATALFVGTNGSSLDATSVGAGAVRTRIVVDGLFAEIDLFVRETAGTANFTCGLEISIDSAEITADLDMQPNAADPRFVDVNLSAEPDLTMTGYGSRFVSGICDDPIIGGIINFFLHNQIAILTRSAFLSNLGDPDGAGPLDSPIAEGIETALAGVSIAGPLGEAIGAVLEAPFASVDEDLYGITLSADSGVTQPNPNVGAPDLSASYAFLDESAPALGGTSPGGAPYDLAYGISISALNQMLKAFVEGGMLLIDITEFEVPGVGTVPLTVGLLSTLIPEFAGQGDPETPVVVSVSSTAAPVITGQPGPQGEMGELRFGGVTVTFDVIAGATLTRALVVDAAFGIGVDFAYNAGHLSFDIASLSEAELDGYVTVNRTGASESTLLTALQGFLPFFEQPLADAMEAFPIPALLGLELSAIEVAPVADWVVLFGALSEIPTSKIENVVVTDMSGGDYRYDGIFDISEWRHRLSSNSTSRTINAALRGFAGADACCTTGDKSAVGDVSYLVEFDVVSVPSETWRIDLSHSISGAFDLARENPTAADGGGFTEFRQGGVVSASYTTSAGDSGSFDFVPTPDRVDHPIGASPFDTHQPFYGSNTAVITGSGDATITLEFDFKVRAHSDSNFWLPLPAVVGDKASIRFGRSDTMDWDFTIGAYPGIGDRSIAEDGHKVSLYLTGLPVHDSCGDGSLDAGEECDDGNSNDGDGCASDCTIQPVCGDGSLDAGEECDDGNSNDGDGCASNCTIEMGGPFCGDGQLDTGEECDDGNNVGGDGCASNCTLESGAVCGNGVVEPPELCEPPNTETCTGLCMTRAPFCGDLFVTPPEVCDDGANDGGDAECLACASIQTCGDGTLEGTELCEVGDTIDCTTLGGGFISGTASCAPTCAAWDSSSCSIGQPGTCTVLYDLNATFQITNTPLGLGDSVFTNLDGSMVVEYTDDGSGNIVDGPVNVLHYWVYNDFIVGGFVTVATKVHGFAPSCNGETAPTWRVDTDPGFPTECGYTGNTSPVASGTLDIGNGEIAWDSCAPSDRYWSASASSGDSYRTVFVSSGPGCLNDFQSVGNVSCAGGSCSLGGLNQGNNPQAVSWVQPLINGPPATGTNSLNVAGDLSTLTTPTGAAGGFQSFNVPNEQQSRTWVSWTATRDSSSPATTCN